MINYYRDTLKVVFYIAKFYFKIEYLFGFTAYIYMCLIFFFVVNCPRSDPIYCGTAAKPKSRCGSEDL